MKKPPVKKNIAHKYDDIFNIEKSNKKHEYDYYWSSKWF